MALQNTHQGGLPEARKIYKFGAADKIGEGGDGTVFRVVHQGTGVTFGMKVFKRIVGDTDDDCNRQVEREAGIPKKVEHPHIVPILAIYWASGMCEPGAGAVLLMPERECSLQAFMDRRRTGVPIPMLLRW